MGKWRRMEHFASHAGNWYTYVLLQRRITLAIRGKMLIHYIYMLITPFFLKRSFFYNSLFMAVRR